MWNIMKKFNENYFFEIKVESDWVKYYYMYYFIIRFAHTTL